jgi:hypothetical protein
MSREGNGGAAQSYVCDDSVPDYAELAGSQNSLVYPLTARNRASDSAVTLKQPFPFPHPHLYFPQACVFIIIDDIIGSVTPLHHVQYNISHFATVARHRRE